MADVKISGLPASTTPLAGTEVLPVVQGGVTKQVSVNNLTTGRSINTAGASLDGAVVINDSGANVNFRVESDTKVNALYVQGSDGFVGVDNGAPTRPLVVRTSAGANPTYGGDIVINSSIDLSGVNTTGGLEIKSNNGGAGYGTRFLDYFNGVSDFIFALQRRSNSATWTTRLNVYPGGQVTPGADGTQDLGISSLKWKDFYLAGNVVIGTSGKGIDFSATAGTGTSELLADYEEGTWTPVVADAATGGNASATVGSGTYTKVGRMVTVAGSIININTTGLTAGNSVYVRDFPFSTTSIYVGSTDLRDVTFTDYPVTFMTGSSFRLFEHASGAGITAITVSDLTAATSDIYFSLTYETI